MKRLNLLTQRDWVALAIALPDSDINSQPINNSSIGHFKFKLGDLDMMIVTDGHILINPPQPIFAPGIPIEKVNAALKDGFMQENEIDAAINILVVFKDKRTIIIDAGSGTALGANAGWFLDNLIVAGIKPEEVTDVLITHLHIDHIGGMLDNEGKSVFKNATFYMPKIEHDFWTSNEPDFSQSKNTESPANSIALARQVITGIKSNLQLLDFGTILFECIRIELADGHTPGHPLLTIFSAGQEMKHIVDVVHTSLLVTHPDWGTQWDTDFKKGIATRYRILQELAVNKQLTMSCHLPWPGLGYIVKKNNTEYEWIPLPVSTPQLYESNGS